MIAKMISIPGYVSVLMAGLIAISCGSDGQTSSGSTDKERLGVIGDSLSVQAQQVLLRHVAEALQKGGAAYAVDFCHTKAGALTDSVGEAASITIQRVTDKPRNSANLLSGKSETLLFKQISDSLANGVVQPHYLLDDQEGKTVYYKPILLGMPACLQCHGAPGTDIESATLRKIKEKYPEDAATGYTLGQLRGMWKITFTRPAQ